MSGLFTVELVFPRPTASLAALAAKVGRRPATESDFAKAAAAREILASVRVLLPDAVRASWAWHTAEPRFEAWCEREFPPGEHAVFGVALLVAPATASFRLLDALAATSRPLPPTHATWDRILRELPKVSPAVLQGDAWAFHPRDADAPGVAAPPDAVLLT
jgi:hypothetical protein